MTRLSVNLNKVATLRNTRPLNIPSVTRAAGICLHAGAHGITVHPRPDQRHVRPSDVHELALLMKEFPGAEFNIEGNPFQKYMHFARDLHPAQCTLVPDEEGQSTSDHGWDLHRDGERLRPVVEELRALGCRVSLFMDAAVDAMKLARQVGADRVELYTEPYASAFMRGAGKESAATFAAAARAAVDEGLGVNAGHDLNLANLPALLDAAPQILEVSIGHALIADALDMGLGATVKAYLATISR
ncbi:MAG: pyridoxine 5'-phosphate synthase [Tepidisphaeraceae bacterium]